MKNEKLKKGDLVRASWGGRDKDGFYAFGDGNDAQFYGIVFDIKYDKELDDDEYWVHLQDGSRVFFWDCELEKAVAK